MAWGISDGDDVNEAYLNDLIEAALGDGNPAQGATYVIFKDDSNIKARNGTTGHIDYSGTDAATVIQAAIDALGSNGGKIYIAKGQYEIRSTLTITESSITLEGAIEGSDIYGGGTILHGDGSTKLLSITGAVSGEIEVVNIRYICFNGAASAKSVGAYGIEIKRATEVHIENCAVRRAGDTGVFIDPGVAEHAEIIWITNSDISINQGDGVEIYNVNNVNLIGCHINHNYEIGVRTGGAYQIKILGGAIKRNEQHGLYLGGGRIKIIGVDIVANDFSDTATYDGVSIANVSDLKIIGCDINDNDRREINIGASANRIQILGNSLYGTDREAVIVVDVSAQNVEIHNNIGYVTENSGITAAIATATAVNHGLAGTPTSVTVTAAESGPTDIYVDTVGGTSFKINYGGGGTKTFYWQAEYAP